MRATALLAAPLLLACATSGAGRPDPGRAPFGGFCGAAEGSGLPGLDGTLRHRDIDLDGDGAPELVVAAEERCGRDDNCPWQVFRRASAAPGCFAPAGELAGLFSVADTRHAGWSDVQSIWRVSPFEHLAFTYEFDGTRYAEVRRESCREERAGAYSCVPGGDWAR